MKINPLFVATLFTFGLAATACEKDEPLEPGTTAKIVVADPTEETPPPPKLTPLGDEGQTDADAPDAEEEEPAPAMPKPTEKGLQSEPEPDDAL